ncbi:MAG: retron St85 family effector protein [Clostridium sp.]
MRWQVQKKNFYRDIIRGKLEDNANLSILYPEDMFMEMLNRKKYDLLTLEKFLASNSDIILIVCESPGSFTELGAFVNNSETLEKVVVLLQTKYKNAKSFIRQGPVEYVRMKYKYNVIYFNNNIDEAVEKIKKYLRNRFWYLGYKRKEPKLKDLNLISGQYYFIILLLYFYQELNVKTLVAILKDLYKMKYNIEEFDIIYSPAIKRLFKEGLIKKEESAGKVIQYKLTDKGYGFANLLLSYVSLENRTRTIDKIRLKIIYSQYY